MAVYGTKKMYLIDEIVFDLPADQITFSFKGTKCTIIQYYRIKYGLEVTSKVQPLVKAKIQRNKFVYLLPELLKLSQHIRQTPKEIRETVEDECALSPV